MRETYSELMVPLFTRLNGGEPDLGLTQRESEHASVVRLARDAIPNHLSQHVISATISHMKSVAELRQELLARVHAQSFQFFERLVIDLLLAMNYGGGKRNNVRHVGRSHDGGIDGIIHEDALGLDVILLQAKRLRPGQSISSSRVREFIGSIEAQHARKGVFFTTGYFTTSAMKVIAAVPHRVVLIDGQQLADLMIVHNIGTLDDESIVFKRVSQTYFSTQV